MTSGYQRVVKLTERRERLRTSTATAHEALEALIGPFNSREAYVGYTRGLEAFRTPLEHSLAAFAAHGARHDRLGAWQPTRIANLLEADLRDLGIEAMPSDAVVHIDDLAWALGAHYVLEGSALGARVLMPAARTLGFDAHHGARHLDKQASTLENFRAFMELLEGIEDLDMEQTAAGANAAFQSAARAMERSFAHA